MLVLIDTAYAQRYSPFAYALCFNKIGLLTTTLHHLQLALVSLMVSAPQHNTPICRLANERIIFIQPQMRIFFFQSSESLQTLAADDVSCILIEPIESEVHGWSLRLALLHDHTVRLTQPVRITSMYLWNVKHKIDFERRLFIGRRSTLRTDCRLRTARHVWETLNNFTLFDFDHNNHGRFGSDFVFPPLAKYRSESMTIFQFFGRQIYSTIL